MQRLSKILIPLSLLAVVSVNAQQLENFDFEQEWVIYYPWTSKTNNGSNTVAIGTTPPCWRVSNLLGTANNDKVELAGRSTYNGRISARISNMRYTTWGKNITGWITLGTPFHAYLGTNKTYDGGTFGGIEFPYRPDALEISYLSPTGSATHHVVAYGWCGEYVQESVPGNCVKTGSNTTVTMIDRDANILGWATAKGGSVTSQGERIFKIDNHGALINGGEQWECAEIPFTYESEAVPEKFNVVVAASNYETKNVTAKAELFVDHIKLLFYSRLSNLSVRGVDVDGFDSKVYDYNIDAIVMPSADEISYELMSVSGSSKAAVEVDVDNAIAMVTVTNVNDGGTDYDGQTSHTYTIHFNLPEMNSTTFAGIIKVGESQLGSASSHSRNVTIYADDDQTATILIPDLTAGETNLGNLLLTGIGRTEIAGGISYSGVTENMSLSGGCIKADASVSGQQKDSGRIEMSVNLLINSVDGEQADIPVAIMYEGSKSVTAINRVEYEREGEAKYFGIDGVEINCCRISPGVYIRKVGNKTSKVIIR